MLELVPTLETLEFKAQAIPSFSPSSPLSRGGRGNSADPGARVHKCVHAFAHALALVRVYPCMVAHRHAHRHMHPAVAQALYAEAAYPPPPPHTHTWSHPRSYP